MTKTRNYVARYLPDYAGYKLIANGGTIYRNTAARPDALLMMIIPALDVIQRNARY